jgi:hypothetical protein
LEAQDASDELVLLCVLLEASGEAVEVDLVEALQDDLEVRLARRNTQALEDEESSNLPILLVLLERGGLGLVGLLLPTHR